MNGFDQFLDVSTSVDFLLNLESHFVFLFSLARLDHQCNTASTLAWESIAFDVRGRLIDGLNALKTLNRSECSPPIEHIRTKAMQLQKFELSRILHLKPDFAFEVVYMVMNIVKCRWCELRSPQPCGFSDEPRWTAADWKTWQEKRDAGRANGVCFREPGDVRTSCDLELLGTIPYRERVYEYGSSGSLFGSRDVLQPVHIATLVEDLTPQMLRLLGSRIPDGNNVRVYDCEVECLSFRAPRKCVRRGKYLDWV